MDIISFDKLINEKHNLELRMKSNLAEIEDLDYRRASIITSLDSSSIIEERERFIVLLEMLATLRGDMERNNRKLQHKIEKIDEELGRYAYQK